MSNNNLSRHVAGEASLKANHILAQRCGCPLTGHHLISHSLFDNLTTERKEQMRTKKYSCNCLENIVILPSSDKFIAKKVACKYQIPWHSSGHTGKKTTENVVIGEDSELYSGKSLEMTADHDASNTAKRVAMFKSDVSSVKLTNPKGYHRYVFKQFSRTLDKLHCDMSEVTYREHIHKLSQEICDSLSEFKIVLHNSGAYFAKNGEGCLEADCNNREHTSSDWPEIESIKNKFLDKISGGYHYLKVAANL
ncbi:hypothetical protein EWS92_20990 [Vibrio vulnificus]|uniref:AHH domain-containing protein n=1 Tax=Vibrio vulnificus TaxID=672 RepID=UPI0005F0D330|nr:AHH domain-containing protein [Vibrio vulnificus]EGR0790755.1 hypothetical protein [Vibrio vulnificus]EGR0799479.1 hypothetical protein [Vibrio vulnificus]EGR0829062.1 hypothetical protein [Vibrio vulnificus]EGR0846643.1 hypothetical protein [Vibrio vulnificus]EGR0853034.1 hypothetical protein [Vibrio vulnificus]